MFETHRSPPTRAVVLRALLCGGFLLSVASIPAAIGQTPRLADEATTDSVRVEYDLCFATSGGKPLRCDVYLPSRPGKKTVAPSIPVMLLVHGGGWTMGDKWMPSGYARSFAEAGIAAVVVNYRLAPQHKFPSQVDDIRAAMLWTKKHAPDYGWDIDRMGLFGYSAGAHLCLMMGTLIDEPLQIQQQTSGWSLDDARWSELPQPRLIVAGGAPCDFRALPPQNRTLAYFLGGSREALPEVYRCASPAAHVSSGDVPTLFIHGARDLIVPMHDSQKMFERQVEAGVASRYLEIAGHGHLVTFQHPHAKRATLEFVRSRLLDTDSLP